MIALPAIALVLTVWTVPAAARPAAPAPPSVCGQQVGAFRFAINDDFRGRILDSTAYATILSELGPVAEACRLGQDAEAGKLLRALKLRWRYR
jgi:hypothetical protein